VCVSMLLDKTIALAKHKLHRGLRLHAHVRTDANFRTGYDMVMKSFGELGCVTCRMYTFDEFEYIIDSFEIGRELLVKSVVWPDCVDELSVFNDLLNMKLSLGANIIA